MAYDDKAVVYVPKVGPGEIAPGLTKHDARSNVQAPFVGIASSVMSANIPGINLYQTAEVNGVSVTTKK